MNEIPHVAAQGSHFFYPVRLRAEQPAGRTVHFFFGTNGVRRWYWWC
jgi:hypothetical protein